METLRANIYFPGAGYALRLWAQLYHFPSLSGLKVETRFSGRQESLETSDAELSSGISDCMNSVKET
jgi:hypothetical protein